MKYYLFAGETYYAAGGAFDFIKHSEELEYLVEYANELIHADPSWNRYEWYHIADEDMNIIYKSNEQAHH